MWLICEDVALYLCEDLDVGPVNASLQLQEAVLLPLEAHKTLTSATAVAIFGNPLED